MTLRLQVVVGQERLAGAPEMAVVGREASFVIGRDVNAHWRLNDPAREISARHCEIRFDGAKYTLHDLSTNGTFLNGSSERIQGQPEIKDGARIELGPFGVLVSVLTDLMDAPASSASVQDKTPAAQDLADTLPRGAPRGLAVRSADPAALLHAMPGAPASALALAASPVVGAQALADEPLTRITPAPKSPIPKPGAVPLAAAAAPVPPVSMLPEPKPDTKPDIKPAVAAAKPMPVAEEPHAHGAVSADWIERLAQGMGVPQTVLANHNPGDLAEMLGQLVRDTAGHLQQQLEAKAADMRRLKAARSTRRRIDPNPLKSVSIPQALGTMLASEAGSPESLHQVFAKSFSELAEHRRKLDASTAVAMNKLSSELSPAMLETVFRDLVPDSSTHVGKARLWDLYRTYWLELADDWPSGLLEAFAQFQAEAMADAAPDAPASGK